MKTPTPKSRRPAPVITYLEQELARDAALNAMVDEQMADLRVVQDLVAIRELRGLSQAQLAGFLGVSQPAIARLESSRSKNLGIQTLVRVAAALGARVRISIEP